MFKKLGIILILCLLCKTVYSETNTFKITQYNLILEEKLIKANQTYSEIITIDSIKHKIPSQIISTVQTGDWIYNLPATTVVTINESDIIDKLVENWDITFANVKKGKILFTRTITNNDNIDRFSYIWNLKITCYYNKITIN